MHGSCPYAPPPDQCVARAAEHGTAKFIRDLVDGLWYKDLKHHHTFYNSIIAKQIMGHPNANCGGIHPLNFINIDFATWETTQCTGRFRPLNFANAVTSDNSPADMYQMLGDYIDNFATAGAQEKSLLA